MEQWDPLMFQVFPEAGPGGRDQTLEAPPILRFHGNGVLLEGGHRSAAGVKQLSRGQRSHTHQSIKSKSRELNESLTTFTTHYKFYQLLNNQPPPLISYSSVELNQHTNSLLPPSGHTAELQVSNLHLSDVT